MKKKFIQHELLLKTNLDSSYLCIKDSELIFVNDGGSKLGFDPPRWLTQDILILSKDGINENDWAYDKISGMMFKVKEKGHSGLIRSEENTFVEDACLKIIASTIDGVGYGISDNSIINYVKYFNLGYNITNVLVEYTESKENVFDLNLNENNEIVIHTPKIEFDICEVIDLCEKSWNKGALFGHTKPNDHYFKQFLNANKLIL